MMLAQKNAANIQFLEERIKGLHDIQNQVEATKRLSLKWPNWQANT